jgi:hypothetical protein
MWRAIILTVAAAVLATGALAEKYESTQLFRRGAWYVELTHDTEDGELWCSAETGNSEAQAISVTAYEDGGVMLFVFDNRWQLSARDVRFFVDIDRSRWTIDGYADGIGISAPLSDSDRAGDFLYQLARGNAARVYNDAGQQLAGFSLSGSSAALGSLMECWDSIMPGFDGKSRKDPF